MKHASAARIREIDRIAQEKYLIPSLVLMENAGLVAALEIIKLSADKTLKKVAVFCGKGNNGGDGFVVARQLWVRGIRSHVFLLCDEIDVKNKEARTNLNILKKFKIPVSQVPDIKQARKIKRLFFFDAAIDAIFGTGFSGMLPQHISNIISFLNESAIPVYSLDVPTGLDATTGKVYDACVKAEATITFGLPKTGFLIEAGPKYTGRVVTCNICYPQELL